MLFFFSFYCGYRLNDVDSNIGIVVRMRVLFINATNFRVKTCDNRVTIVCVTVDRSYLNLFLLHYKLLLCT